MTPTKIICSNCGYATNEDVGEGGVTTKVGRCCENLPAPYEFDSRAGMYSRPVGGSVGNAETDEESDECNCPDCVENQIGELIDREREELWSLYDDNDPSYAARLRALGW